MQHIIENNVKEAIEGNPIALEKVIKFVQDDVYYLSLRMLAHPENAKDATQEILIRIITKLSSFKFESKFKTWVYRVASNYLISYKINQTKEQQLTFDIFKQDLESDLDENYRLSDDALYQTMLDELRISCTMAMLLCLSPTLRISFILGEVLELNHQEASNILNINKYTYRQQLSRARRKLIAFMQENCGLVSTAGKCSCESKLKGALIRGRINVKHPYFSQTEDGYKRVQERLAQTQESLKAITLQCNILRYPLLDKFDNILVKLIY